MIREITIQYDLNTVLPFAEPISRDKDPINFTGSTFISPTNPRMSLFLSQPLHVPSITKNLISVSKFAKIIVSFVSSIRTIFL